MDSQDVDRPDINCVPISTVFTRLNERHPKVGIQEHESTTASDKHTILPGTHGPINRAFLCLDTSNNAIRTRIVTLEETRRRRPADAVDAQSTSLPYVAPGEGSIPQLPDLPYVDIGDCDQICEHCGALFWYGERIKTTRYQRRPEYRTCCAGGKYYIRPDPPPPAFVRELLANAHFMEHIRAYNQMFAMTSFGAKIDDTVNRGRGPYVFKISGQIYHWIGSLCPEEGDPPRFLQLYIYDTKDEISNRMSSFAGNGNHALNEAIVAGLVQVLDEHNGLVQLFRTTRDMLGANDLPAMRIRLYSKGGRRGYELPQPGTLGGIVFEDGRDTNTDFDVIVQLRGGYPQRINKQHQSYMSLQSPLIFIFGQPGYYPQLSLKPRSGKNDGKKVSMNAYYKYQLHPRVKEFGLLFRCGRLFQQYVVAVFCNIEQYRLDWVRKNQKELRSDYLLGLYDVVSRGDRQGIQAGSMIMLLRTFTGGPRYMYSHYLDALAICRSLGNRQYFITFTCNVNWPEIKRFMSRKVGLSPGDRPDAVCRVFQEKVKYFIKFLKEEKPFGSIIGCKHDPFVFGLSLRSYYLQLYEADMTSFFWLPFFLRSQRDADLYTIEFQKRGLPHCHTLIWVNKGSRITDASQIDDYISAEMPNPEHDPRGYKIVTELMVHGPCGIANTNAPCTDNGVCKSFPPKI